MVLLKAFFRKEKTKLYIKIFSILFSILFILNGFSNYYEKSFDEFRYDHASLVMMAKNDYKDLLLSDKGIQSVQRGLSFYKGQDGEVVYEAPVRVNGGTVEYIPELKDESKIEWKSLIYRDEIIMAFQPEKCNVNLEDDEVVLSIYSSSYDEELVDQYIGKEIHFNYNNRDILLYLKDIVDTKVDNYICIPNELYNKLLDEEKNYIYSIETTNYNELDNVVPKLKDLEDNDFYYIGQHVAHDSIESAQKASYLDNMVRMLKVVNFIAMIIFFIVTIFVIRDLVGDEENDSLLLKEIGFNKKQNLCISLRNLLVLNILTFIFSILFSGLVIILINILFYFKLDLFDFIFIFKVSLFVLIVEVLLTAFSIRRL